MGVESLSANGVGANTPDGWIEQGRNQPETWADAWLVLGGWVRCWAAQAPTESGHRPFTTRISEETGTMRDGLDYSLGLSR